MAASVSVIVPFYNRKHVLERAIDSVLKQSFQDWELVLVDDASTDEPLDLINKYSADSRVRYLKLELNSGAAAARNAGIRHSKSDYIALLDSDDKYHPRFLEISLAELTNADEGYGFSYTGVGDIATSSGDEMLRKVWTLPEEFNGFKTPYLYQLQIGTAAGILIKRRLFDIVGLFDEAFEASEDTDWFIRSSRVCKGLPIHQNLIFKDNSTQDRLTLNYGKNARAYRILVSKNSEEIEASPVLSRRWHYKCMWLNFYSGDKKEARNSFNILKKSGVLDLKTQVIYLTGLIVPRRTFISLHKKFANR